MVLKRAQYFLLCKGKGLPGLTVTRQNTVKALIDGAPVAEAEQLSLFGAEERPRLAEVKEVAAECLASAM